MRHHIQRTHPSITYTPPLLPFSTDRMNKLQVMVGIAAMGGKGVLSSTFPCVVEQRVGSDEIVVGADHLRDVHVVGLNVDAHEDEEEEDGEEEDGEEEEKVDVSFPVDFRGIVSDWDNLQAVYTHALSTLPPSPSPSPPSPLRSIILPMPVIFPSAMRSKIERMMLETFGFARVATPPRPLLPLYTHGYTSGVVIDIGEVRTVITPVIKGMVVVPGVKTVPVNGRDITRRLHRLISHPQVDLRVAKDIRDTLCYLSLPDSDQAAEDGHGEYLLPGLEGEILSVGSSLHEAPECLFSPPLVGYDAYGLAEALVASIDACAREHSEGGDVRKMMHKRIVVAGWGASLPNLFTRLESEIRRVHSPHTAPAISKIRILPSSVFQGASLLGDVMRPSSSNDHLFWTT